MAYLVLGLLASASLDAAGWNDPWLELAAGLLGAVIAVDVGSRLGRLTAAGIVVASLLLALAAQLTEVTILDSLARPAGVHMAWMALYRAPHLANTLEGLLAMVLGPLLWFLVLRRRATLAST